MNRLFIAVLALCFVSFEGFTQTTEVVAYWKKGDKQKIKTHEGFIEYEGSKIIKKEVTTSLVEMIVLQENETSYTIEWNYTDSSVDKINMGDEEEEDIYKELDKLFSKLRIVYKTDEFGSFQQVTNMMEIKTSLTDSLHDFIKNNFEDEKEGEMFYEIMSAMLLSEDMEDQISSEIQTYHYYLGDVFTDTLANYVEERPSQFGKEVIPVKGAVEVISNPTNETITINDKKIYEPTALKKAMIGVGKNLKKGPKRLKKAFDGHEFEMIDTEDYKYNYRTGFLQYYKQKRSFSSEGKRKDSFIIIEEI